MPGSDSYIIKNPLRRDGTSQKQRQLTALDPAYVLIDERTLQDFLVFARDFARQVYYFNDDNKIEGDWEEFWAYDISVIIAAIEQTNPQPDRQRFFQVLESEPTNEGLAQLFILILEVAKKLDHWSLYIQPANELKDLIYRLVRANLGSFLKQVAALEKGAYDVLGSQLYPKPDMGKYLSFSPLWKLGDFNDINPDLNLFRKGWEPAFLEEPPPSLTEREKLAVAYEKLKNSFNQVYNVYFQVIRQSGYFFDKSLLVSDHEPYIALFIAFLKLYQKVQRDLNMITEKHLDYYYKDVLQLKTRQAVPDKVHVYFALAKHLGEHILEKDTRFLAGKDMNGVDLYYALDNDIVINKAQVECIHTLFVERNDDEVKNLYAAPVANSADGQGAEISDEEKPSWMTFGSDQMPEANIGFAIASNELLLADGTRTITLNVNYVGTTLPTTIGDIMEIWFSGEEGLFKPASDPVLEASNGQFIITIILDPEEPAVVPFNQEVLEENLGTQLPVMKVLLKNSAAIPPEPTINVLKDMVITSLELGVVVTGITDLVAFSDLGPLDISKSFLPFGPAPVVGSSFFIGSKEAFQKNLTEVTLNLVWENLPKKAGILDFNNHYLGYLAGGISNNDFTFKSTMLRTGGEEELANNKQFFATQDSNQDVSIVFDNANDQSTIIVQHGSNLANSLNPNKLHEYGTSPNAGFLRLDLGRDFEHYSYPNILSRQLIASAWLPDNKTLPGAYYIDKSDNSVFIATGTSQSSSVEIVIVPNEPYTPSIKNINLDYSSNVVLDQSDFTHFIHLHPFKNTYQSFDEVSNVPVLPQLHINDSSVPPVNLEGCLMLGFKQLRPKQSLSLLFQVAENTADADVNEAKVQWQYLSDNNWIDFKEYEITNDTTRGLITSGIIVLTIPETNTEENTILSKDLYWIRAWVEKNSAAVSEMIKIHTQAAQLTFQDNNNDPSHLSSPLESGRISQLENDVSAIDSISQDYYSFGGRVAEKPLMYYTRVSEQLRHKGRAITLYDYEHLVLEQFPDIYKVKCINHTNQDDQLAPGNVLVAVIPDFTQMKAVDRRQPKVTRGRLDEIREYLESKNTTFVGTFSHSGDFKNYLHVVNPKYKKIRVNFYVRFKPDATGIEFHILKLKEAIVRYLSPWAYDDGAEINFGGKVFKSSILDFGGRSGIRRVCHRV